MCQLFISPILSIFNVLQLEFKEHAGVEHTAGEIVGDSVLLIGDVSNPIIAVYIVDAEQVETVYAKPDIPERHILPLCFSRR